MHLNEFIGAPEVRPFTFPEIPFRKGIEFFKNEKRRISNNLYIENTLYLKGNITLHTRE